MKNLLLIILLLFVKIKGSQTTLTVGLLVDNHDPIAEKIFQKAIEMSNTESPEISMVGITSNITNENVFESSKKLCKLLKSGIVAVISCLSKRSSLHATSVCDAKEMPYIDNRLDFHTQLSTINLYPHPNQLAKALRDIVEIFGWKEFTILYESGYDLELVNELLELCGSNGHQFMIVIRRYDLDLKGNYRKVLRSVKMLGCKRFVVVGRINSLPEFFLQAQQVGLMTDAYQYIIGNLDLQTIDLEPYQHSEVNITSFRIISPESSQFKELEDFFTDSNTNPPVIDKFSVTVNVGLIFDSVFLLAETFKSILFDPISLNCYDDKTWDKGFTLVNYLKSTNIKGLTGEIKFDNQGLRTEIVMDVIELTTAGISKIGYWKSNSGLELQRKHLSSLTESDSRSLVNKTFIVMTALSDPYGMLKETSVKLTGNEQFEGFGIELIQELSKKLGFTYIFRLQEDNAYGSYNAETGQWNGMLREILDNRADLAITDLTMTSERESAVDFTIPFMNLGIAILYKKPTKEPPKLFSFMEPFSGEVWLYLGIAYFSVSLSLFVLGRMSPTEWDNPYPCIEEPEELENQFTFANSLWFTMGALLQQGSEIAPKAASTRTVASTWWFFTLIMVSSYTANLAAFLTVESLSTPIESAEDLAAGKGGVKYGAKKGGSTLNFFKDAKYPTYQKMYEYMKEHPENLPSSNAEGVRRVENENYAFLMESTSIEYIIERKCSLTQVGNLLDEKGYGIAMRKNWVYRDALSGALLELQEQGVLTKMKTKWWKEKRGGGACSDTGGDSGALALEVANLGGVFVVLIFGSFFAVLVSFFEMLMDVKSRAQEKKVSFKGELMKELKFLFKCSGNVKTVEHKDSSKSNSKKSSKSDEELSNLVGNTNTKEIELVTYCLQKENIKLIK